MEFYNFRVHPDVCFLSHQSASNFKFQKTFSFQCFSTACLASLLLLHSFLIPCSFIFYSFKFCSTGCYSLYNSKCQEHLIWLKIPSFLAFVTSHSPDLSLPSPTSYFSCCLLSLSQLYLRMLSSPRIPSSLPVYDFAMNDLFGLQF